MGEDNSLRRLSLLDEFPEKTHPEGLNMADELIMNGNKMIMEELFYFVREQYPMIIGDDIGYILPYYEHVLGIEKPKYYPRDIIFSWNQGDSLHLDRILL